jgi:hypothetical protein
MVVVSPACTDEGSWTVDVKETGEEQLTVDGLNEMPPEPPDLTTSRTATIAMIAMPAITNMGGIDRLGASAGLAPANTCGPGWVEAAASG